MNILFVCTANRDRSRTAELHFQAKYPEHRFRSAGISKYASEKHGGVQIKRYMCDVADRIICMEFCHSDYIIRQIDKCFNSKIEVLDLGDTESFMSEQLVAALESKFTITA